HRPASRATHKHQGVISPNREDDDFQRGPPVLQNLRDCHSLRARTASVILTACSVSATSCVRTICAPAFTPRHAQASAAGKRSFTSAPSNCPINDFLET